MHSELETDVRQLESLRRRLRTLEKRYAALEPTSAEAREIASALASARASLDLAYGNLPPALAGPRDEPAH